MAVIRRFVAASGIAVAVLSVILGYYLAIPPSLDGIDSPYWTRLFAGTFAMASDLVCILYFPNEMHTYTG